MLGSLLLAKHFVADGPLQTDYMALNKGKLGHLGGISHALVHGLFTFAVLLVWKEFWVYSVAWVFIAKVSLLEALAHYLIDLVTRYATDRYKWVTSQQDEINGEIQTVVRNKAFYRMFVADQCLHMLTYLVILSVVLS